MTYADLLKQAILIDSYLYRADKMLIQTDPGEETDWLMVSSDGQSWECVAPTESVK